MLTLSQSRTQVGVYAVDPDLHFLSLVGLDMNGQVIAVGQTDVRSCRKGNDAAVDLALEVKSWHMTQGGCILPERRILIIEDQVAYMGGKNTGSLILLARASGIALLGYQTLLRPHETRFVRPHDWKGSVPKNVHQDRIVSRCGLQAVKKGYNHRISWPGEHAWAAELPASRQSHLIDALGLAMWGLKQPTSAP